MIHHKLKGDPSICKCGGEIIWLCGSWHCVKKIQEQLVPTNYSIFKKEEV